MIEVDNQFTVNVDITAIPGGYAWTYSPGAIPLPEGVSVTPAGVVTVPTQSGSWKITYSLSSAQFQLFSVLINTNPAQATGMCDFDQLLEVDAIPGPLPDVTEDVLPSPSTSTATICFANNSKTAKPVGISFQLLARTVVGSHFITSPDPQVKNTGEV
ncbi:hypothetical protein GE253_04325 [Niveispirillum sp. SYP-B3756]|uniref:hypothetical protein n=1 Tax=Niveispirillum sp. SYP-B3756 TaxID=2662178 RepID=UPI001291EA36|nr:hypothetical protein [Niveispirillum sp. SYP-B3756]MQP64566.1 hypothetical protein [Niveispirillum sp. SYP-B3756]